MNRHFQDARYYLKRAGETAKKGLATELSPVVTRVRKLTGREVEPEASRRDEIKAELRSVKGKAESEAKSAVDDARQRVESYRKAEV